MRARLWCRMIGRVFLFGLAVAIALVAPAQAASGGETLDRMLPELRAEHPGRLVDAETRTGPNGHSHYHIKWMTPDGRILFFDL